MNIFFIIFVNVAITCNKDDETYSVKICRKSLANEHLCSITLNAATATLFSEHSNNITTAIRSSSKLSCHYFHLTAIFLSKPGSAGSPLGASLSFVPIPEDY